MTPLGFVPEPLTIALDRILPSRRIPDGLYGSRKFKQIQASIDAVGLIEPLIVGQADKSGQHVLLDGHIRPLVLREMEFTDAPCLVATDDESRPRPENTCIMNPGRCLNDVQPGNPDPEKTSPEGGWSGLHNRQSCREPFGGPYSPGDACSVITGIHRQM